MVLHMTGTNQVALEPPNDDLLTRKHFLCYRNLCYNVTRTISMINIQFQITNPLRRRWETIFYKVGPPPKKGKYRVWEVQAFKDDTILSFSLQWTFLTDHAGIEVGAGLFGYSIQAGINDTRHWNKETNSWEVYGYDTE